MKLSDLSIKRPVLATVMSLIIVLVGVVAFRALSVREYPNIDPPVVTVETHLTGASAEIIETQVTKPLEESIAGIEGIDFLSSISREETSQITVTFKLERDPDAAANDVRDRVSRARDKLPDEVDEPIISKVEADAQPIIYLSFWSDRHSSLEITDYADRHVKDRLQSLPGAAAVRIFGERRYAMRVWLDPAELAARDLTVQDVEDAIRRQNADVPAGRVESKEREFTVLAETDLRTPEQFKAIVLSQKGGYLTRLGDVARVDVGSVEERRIVRFNGQNAIALGVIKQSTANALEVGRAVREAVPEIAASLPEGMKVQVAYDRTVFIDKSIQAVFGAIGEAALLVVLIIFLFLRSVRATLIPLVTIPVSLIGALAIMLALGFSINTLTMLAFVLAIGLVVDDAIVMLENIYRHVERGESPIAAAFRGSKEIGFAVISMTLTLAAVFIPVGFMTGTTGRLFTEFAWTLAGAVIVSGFVALTVSPMMSSKLLRHNARPSWFYRVGERFLERMTEGYRRLLRAALKARIVILLIGAAVAGGGFFLFTNLQSELAPVEDRGSVLLFALGPEGATVDYMDKYAKQIEKIAQGIPEGERYFMVIGFPTVNQAISFVGLKPWEDRERSQMQIAGSIAPALFSVPGVLAFPINLPSLGQRVGEKPVQFVIQSNRPYAELDTFVEKLVAKAREYPGLANIDTDLKLNKPRLTVSVDRDKLADLGIGVETVGRTLETLLGGRQVTRFKRAGENYDVIVQTADIDRSNPDDLNKFYVRAASGAMVPLSNLIRVKETVAPKELNHFNQLRSVTLSANVADGYTLGQALTYLRSAAREVLPPGTQTDLAGQTREFSEASTSLYITFGLALLFIYLVLSAQFESFRDPFVIMLAVPLSISGALAALWFTGGTLNIYSQIGLITLIGLITKHGILIVEFANQLRSRTADRFSAVVEAAGLRLRPILMTTGAMVLGAVPLALATGAGSESRQAIGWVIVGGLLVGTFFTLFVIPAVYTYIARKQAMAPIEEPTEEEEAPEHEEPLPEETPRAAE